MGRARVRAQGEDPKWSRKGWKRALSGVAGFILTNGIIALLGMFGGVVFSLSQRYPSRRLDVFILLHVLLYMYEY